MLPGLLNLATHQQREIAREISNHKLRRLKKKKKKRKKKKEDKLIKKKKLTLRMLGLTGFGPLDEKEGI